MNYADDANIGMAMGLSAMTGLGELLILNPHSLCLALLSLIHILLLTYCSQVQGSFQDSFRDGSTD